MFKGEKPEEKKEGMTWGGFGNAAAGTFAAKAAIDLFTPENGKPATKGNITNRHLNYLDYLLIFSTLKVLIGIVLTHFKRRKTVRS